MSINTAITGSDLSPSLWPSERLLSRHDGVQFSIESGGGYPGQGGCYHANKGTAYLTSKRIVFVTNPPLDYFKTFEVYMHAARDVNLRQPLFGANELLATILPAENGGLVGPGRLKMTFREGGAVEFHSLLLHTLSHAPSEPDIRVEEQLPAYTEQPADATAMRSASTEPPGYQSE